MPIAYPTINQKTQVFLSKEEISSLFYHNLFDYPLTMGELIKWATGPKAKVEIQELLINQTSGLYHLTKNPSAPLKRLMRKRISARKFEMAGESAKILSLIPTIKMVGITGALAMENASEEADIDLMVVTRKGTLWTTRLMTYLALKIMNYGLRKPGDKNQKDKLCLNIWLDEGDLVFRKRNIYTAHEIAQIRPLINRDHTYEKFIVKNRWIKDYWPNAVRVQRTKYEVRSNNSLSTLYSVLTTLVESIAFKLQYAYMKSKITRETITPTRALFHPVDWSEYVLSKLV